MEMGIRILPKVETLIIDSIFLKWKELKKNQPFLLNFDDKTNTILKESEHQQLPLD